MSQTGINLLHEHMLLVMMNELFGNNYSNNGTLLMSKLRYITVNLPVLQYNMVYSII
jgi:hypothetical protein